MGKFEAKVVTPSKGVYRRHQAKVEAADAVPGSDGIRVHQGRVRKSACTNTPLIRHLRQLIYGVTSSVFDSGVQLHTDDI